MILQQDCNSFPSTNTKLTNTAEKEKVIKAIQEREVARTAEKEKGLEELKTLLKSTAEKIANTLEQPLEILVGEINAIFNIIMSTV